jgi:hypothetical protein
MRKKDDGEEEEEEDEDEDDMFHGAQHQLLNVKENEGCLEWMIYILI